MQNERKQNKTYHWFGFGVISQLLWNKQTKQVRKQQTKQTQTTIGRSGVAKKVNTDWGLGFRSFLIMHCTNIIYLHRVFPVK